MSKFAITHLTVCLALIFGAAAAAETHPPAEISATYSQNSAANALFLKARDLAKNGDPRFGGKLSNARAAIDVYKEAIRDDPKFALAYVEMARTWMSLGYSDPDSLPDSITMPQAQEDLSMALEIDPKLAEAHQLSATIAYTYDFDWTKAGAEYREAVMLKPDSAAVHTAYASYLTSMGRFEDALGEYAKANAIEPSPSNDVLTARAYYSMREFGKAEEYCRTSIAKKDNVLAHAYLGFALIAEGRPRDAIPELETAQHFSKNAGAAAILAYGYASVGESAKAEDTLERLLMRNEYGPPVDYRIAAIYLALGDRKRALEWLDKSYADHENWINQLKVDPVMDPLRSDPHFQSLMNKLRFL